MTQAISLKMKTYDGAYSEMTFYPFAVWHNQKTGKITIRTQDGFLTFPADAVDTIGLIQNYFDFDPLAR